MYKKHKSYTKIYKKNSNMQDIVVNNIKYSVKHCFLPVNGFNPYFINFNLMNNKLCGQSYNG
jgi:hypothetical protein